MSTAKKELWLIVSPTECKRVHELKKPHVLEFGHYGTFIKHYYDAAKKEWEEAERTLNIHPELLKYGPGNIVHHVKTGEEPYCVVSLQKGNMVEVVTAQAYNRTFSEQHICKFPLNSIWHGEEREGKIWLTDKI